MARSMIDPSDMCSIETGKELFREDIISAVSPEPLPESPGQEGEAGHSTRGVMM